MNSFQARSEDGTNAGVLLSQWGRTAEASHCAAHARWESHNIYLLCQTTDSGSNNNTMAKMMHQKLSDLEGSELPWDYDTMHIKCFCHKMALV
ncbi:hypothetical protein VP01_5560g2, partial [Puccinia sorghi]